MTDGAVGDVTFYWGAASGSAQKALRHLEEPRVCLNYATQNNRLWATIDELFVDSGGYSFLCRDGQSEYATSDAAYLDYVEEYEPALWALRIIRVKWACSTISAETWPSPAAVDRTAYSPTVGP